ncbi:MAG: hypothetical protein BMS9Abin26_1491 [Gammaproteobacteria bacterium]|nr:MAG: hypothetical protein BMS9Abin26_1491 [Gammaproteobacteria bacterium]
MGYTRQRKQEGQAMVEYVVVVFFFVLLLAAPIYDPDDPNGDDTFKDFEYAKRKNAAGRNLNSIEVVREVLQDNYNGYTFALSISEYPDYLPLQEEQQMLYDLNDQLQDINNIKEGAVDFVKNNLPPSLPSIGLPGGFSLLP